MSDETVQERAELMTSGSSEKGVASGEASQEEKGGLEEEAAVVADSETPLGESVSPSESLPAEPPHASSSEEASFEEADLGSEYASSFRRLRKGDLIEGVVVQVGREEVLVDVGAKSEGIIPLSELSRQANVPPESVVSVGERVWVCVLETENQGGNPILSKRRADLERAWMQLKQAKATNANVEGKVVARVKGGLQVEVGPVGLSGFVPASHVGIEGPRVNLDRYIGQTIPLKVLDVDRTHKRIVLSNRLAAEEERQKKLEEVRASLQPGQVRRGVVRRLTTYGAFVDLGGVDGLLHISEMSWSRLNDPKELLHEGQEIEVYIIKVDLEQERISLSLRRIQPDPWERVATLYREGDILTGTVTRVIDSGAFVQLEEGIEGYLPNSEMLRNKSGRTIPVSVGEEVTVKLLRLRLDERKMSLSQRAASPPEPVVVEQPLPPPSEENSGSKRKRSKKRGRRDEEDEEHLVNETDDRPLYTMREAFKAARRRMREEELDVEEDVELTDVEEEGPPPSEP